MPNRSSKSAKRGAMGDRNFEFEPLIGDYLVYNGWNVIESTCCFAFFGFDVWKNEGWLTGR